MRRLIIWLIVLALLGGGGFWAYQKFFKKEAPSKTALTDFAYVGSITSKVEGSGLTKARNSKTISVPYQGTILELLVEEGQQVYAGDPLYTVDSPAA
ncbi:MAG: efflux RND transporter periplasmic adaptor subunit, partial [Firmicutes bacterium]|nr:efflux RND transporter periplasmic adaptor subunit [Bacillota bacterium]